MARGETDNGAPEAPGCLSTHGHVSTFGTLANHCLHVRRMSLAERSADARVVGFIGDLLENRHQAHLHRRCG
ncbi:MULTISPECIES: hypothetical protein [Xanthomonas translucens group]|uniref:Uncharacterized protein n=1 Tax=Xanthomonas cerealis pv. cerealis TaxID=152263 RepID=A0A514EAZ0_9XANT|nr:hypothetical protein [Xanthomonas translucens]QDI03112.1 hypothetical protein E4A48_04855 [Xanthomonas translucens pv. cerealis]UKE48515.1 hypothetical protein KHA79_07930 [Xanthomonas translucens pv. cerealis]